MEKYYHKLGEKVTTKQYETVAFLHIFSLHDIQQAGEGLLKGMAIIKSAPKAVDRFKDRPIPQLPPGDLPDQVPIMRG